MPRVLSFFIIYYFLFSIYHLLFSIYYCFLLFPFFLCVESYYPVSFYVILISFLFYVDDDIGYSYITFM